VEPEVPLPVVESQETLTGRIVNPYDLEAGQCFNEYLTSLEGSELLEITTVVDCAGPHDGEIYHQVMHPAAAYAEYIGAAEMEAWAQIRCYREFRMFVGSEYELSELEIGTLYPSQESWNHPEAQHREVTCYVYAWEGGQLLGSMRNSGF